MDGAFYKSEGLRAEGEIDTAFCTEEIGDHRKRRASYVREMKSFALLVDHAAMNLRNLKIRIDLGRQKL